jgi:hypothetical protein
VALLGIVKANRWETTPLRELVPWQQIVAVEYWPYCGEEMLTTFILSHNSLQEVALLGIVEANRWEMAPLRELLSWQWIASVEYMP